MRKCLRSRCGDDELGVITAFVVIIGLALFLFAGLVYDGGMALRAKVDAVNDASAAARAAAQQLDLGTLRSTGALTLDPAAASDAADSYLTSIGRSGTVAVNGDEVTVTVSFRQPTALLGIADVGSFAISGSASATATEGP
jgi:Flp pilus assembly protein TadG